MKWPHLAEGCDVAEQGPGRGRPTREPEESGGVPHGTAVVHRRLRQGLAAVRVPAHQKHVPRLAPSNTRCGARGGARGGGRGRHRPVRNLGLLAAVLRGQARPEQEAPPLEPPRLAAEVRRRPIHGAEAPAKVPAQGGEPLAVGAAGQAGQAAAGGLDPRQGDRVQERLVGGRVRDE